MIFMSKFFAGGGEMMEWKTALTPTGGVAGTVVRVSAFHLLDREFVFLVHTHAKRVRQRSAHCRGFCPGARVSTHRRVRYCGLEFAPSVKTMKYTRSGRKVMAPERLII